MSVAVKIEVILKIRLYSQENKKYRLFSFVKIDDIDFLSLIHI